MTHDEKDQAIAAARTADIAVWEARVTVEKYEGDAAFAHDGRPYEVVVSDPNMLMLNGVQALWQLVTAQSATAFSAANCYLGVGDATLAAANTQTDLAAASNKVRKQVSSAPAIAGNVVTFTSVFGTSDANFTWNEFGTFNAASSGVMLNRVVSSLGTKTNSASWTVNMSITIA